MIGARRTGGVLATLGLGVALVLGRMAHVQLVQGGRWASEAASLVRRGERVPFMRGSIVDARGAVLARDRAGYEVVLSYRDFRRGHPLALVAHARTALTGRTVTLADARAALVPWALDLVALTPAALGELARGASLASGRSEAAQRAPAALERGSDAAASRAQRALDLGYYASALIAGAAGFDAVEEARFARARRAEEHAGRSLWELAGVVRPALAGRDPEEALTGHLTRAVADLEELARALELAPGADGSCAEGLLELLEIVRGRVEDLVAARLFAAVAGFGVGQIEPAVLLGFCDLAWLRSPLAWDEARAALWAGEARARYLDDWRRGTLAPAIARAIEVAAERGELVADPAAAVECAANLLGACFDGAGAIEAALDGADAEPWRELGPPALVEELGSCFAARPSGALAARWERPVLPFEELDYRALDLAAGDPWALLELFAPGRAAPTAAGTPSARGFRAALGLAGRERPLALTALVVEILDAWEAELAARSSELVGALAAENPAELLAFAPGRLEDVHTRAQYALRDYGSRAIEIRRDPPYELVFLLARHPERYPGFEARPTRSRERVREAPQASQPSSEPESPGAHLPGALLVGAVARADRARPDGGAERGAADAARLAELERQAERSAAEEAELARLIGQELGSEQLVGSSGIERLCEPALRGRHGYVEHLGLEQVLGSGSAAGEARRLAEVVHGRDLGLTLDLEVQRAAERCLEHPARDPEPEKRDDVWLANPVGALVLVSLEGDVIAAASAPTWNSVIAPDAPRQRQEVRERAFHQPFAQPPGSALKAFVAAWALEHYDLDPRETVDCLSKDGAPASLYGVRCSESAGHGAGIDLSRALRVSCNCYFAWLGMHFSPGDMQSMLGTFGFGQPTGVTRAWAWDGFEDVGDVAGLDEPRELALAANGLAVIDATPAQVARAMAALASGALSELRLVSRVGGVELERAPARPLAIAEEHLERVRQALRQVTGAAGGSAYRAFGEDPLPFEVAAKTGSADLEARPKSAERVRKHTWLAGYFPADEPLAAFAVFCSDTRATSSHSAAWIGKDFLSDPALQAWLERALAERSAPPERGAVHAAAPVQAPGAGAR